MARKRKLGDESYNARRRYSREAQRYLSRSESATGANKSRLEELARLSAEKAMSTYETKPTFAKLPKGLKKVALATGAEFPADTDKAKRKRLIDESTTALVKGRTKEQRREYEAKSLMNGPIGSRIMAGLKNIWEPARIEQADGTYKVDWKQAQALIFDSLGVSSWADVIERFQEEFGDELFENPKSRIKYDELTNMALATFE